MTAFSFTWKNKPDDVIDLIEIAKLLSPAVALLVIACFITIAVLWRKLATVEAKNDELNQYLRKNDKENLKVMVSLESAIKQTRADVTTTPTLIIGELNKVENRINDRIASIKEHRKNG